jgi:hypothetical protein
MTIPRHSASITALTQSLETTFCRYNLGKLEKSTLALRTTNYLAISHVWGEAEWRVLSVLDGEKILASKEKARFIEDGLREFTGEEYFWMDVLCVDQGNADARVAITQHIPAIFRRAQKTIVIRDGYVFRNVALTPWVPPAY